MASTGFMLIALSAGASPARTPRMLSNARAAIAAQKLIWKCAVSTPSVVEPSSSISRTNTVKRMPIIPATMVRTTLSAIICERMFDGVAPMARRIPISVVRSFTVTIMMLLTPMAPARSVPMPTSMMRKFTPENRLSSIPNITSELNTLMAFSSVGSIWCAFAMTRRIFDVMSLIATPRFAVTAMRCTVSPRY